MIGGSVFLMEMNRCCLEGVESDAWKKLIACNYVYSVL